MRARIETTILLVLTACAALIAALCAAAAEETLISEHLEASLVAEQALVRPGDTVSIALYQKMAPGWHTYWRNPGDSGQPPAISWQLPAGTAASQPHWPAPERIPYGPLVNYGYSDETALISDIVVPADWEEGRPFPVAADVELLVCSDICIPVAGSLALDVPTGARTTVSQGGARLFAAARAQVPATAPWPAVFGKSDTQLHVRLTGGRDTFAAVKQAYFFTDQWGAAEHAAAQSFQVTDAGLSVLVPRGQTAPGERLSGVLALKVSGAEGDVTQSFEIEAPFDAALALPPANPPRPAEGGPGLALILLFALAGGAILNLMPCVFPILAIKALGLAAHAGAERRERMVHGLSYTAGVVVSFVGLAGLLLAARAGGEAVGWGFQLQNPLVVGALAYVATLIGLNLSGVFEISGRLAGIGDTWASRSGHVGSFATGVLAAVVAAPCTAPFMAAAVGGALLLPVPGALAVFALMGLGLALPYLVLAAAPALARLLPRPGPWMVRFRQALAFPMYATAAWLIWVMTHQAGADAALLATLGLILLAFALWLVSSAAGKARVLTSAAVAVVLAGSVALLVAASAQKAAPARTASTSGLAQPFTQARLDRLLGEGRAVFVNMTADWCISCKFNERVALSGTAFADTLERHAIVYLQGDWTTPDPEITSFLKRFGRAGVPLYVLYPAGGGAPQVLPQILDPGALRRALETAAIAKL